MYMHADVDYAAYQSDAYMSSEEAMAEEDYQDTGNTITMTFVMAFVNIGILIFIHSDT